MKQTLVALAIAFTLFSCNKEEKRNEEMLELYSSKPHDKELEGWWKHSDDMYIHFDTKLFNYSHGYLLNDGSVHEKIGVEIWYSENDTLYTYNTGSWKEGGLETNRAYKIVEEDGVDKLYYYSEHNKEYYIQAIRASPYDNIHIEIE